MSISLKCNGCQSTLRVRDELSGKKVKCPRCQTVLVVPKPAEVAVGAAAGQTGAARPRTGKTGRIQATEPAPRRKQAIRTDRDRGQGAVPPVAPSGRTGGKPGKYKPCPKCGADGARRVKWTAWGSFYGPRLFTHVACQECGYCYNGKTGRSNLLAAIIFVSMPLLGIVGIIGGIVWMLMQRGYLKF
jgi:predicted Zn finger-like uncharacterized protein